MKITNNYPNWLVPLYIAKELKEIGFDEPCLVVYHEVFDEEMIFISFDDSYYYYADLSNCSQRTNSEMGKDILEVGKHYSYACSLPTWEQALAWFREKGYYGNIEATSKGTSAYIFFPELDNGEFWEFAYEETYEKARELLLLKLIDLYKTANQ
jgi:hypothetical protein|nr:MAG TPA: hypothetical protein [Caudoviricetes sp.]